LKAAFDGLPLVQQQALRDAAARVRSYHEAQKKASGESWTYRDADGTLLGQKVTPLDRVGIYVPGGKAAYPSSVLDERHPCPCGGCGRDHHGGAHRPKIATPQAGEGKKPLVLAAPMWPVLPAPSPSAGAQAVAALAYGTATVPAVYEITGPG
jgi:histidinol dehydrogenase